MCAFSRSGLHRSTQTRGPESRELMGSDSCVCSVLRIPGLDWLIWFWKSWRSNLETPVIESTILRYFTEVFLPYRYISTLCLLYYISNLDYWVLVTTCELTFILKIFSSALFCMGPRPSFQISEGSSLSRFPHLCRFWTHEDLDIMVYVHNYPINN